MSKEKEIELPAWCTIEEAVNILLDAKEKGQRVYCSFNGVILHSNTVTMDDAYLTIIGKTKAEFEESKRKWYEESKKIKDAERNRAIERIPDQIEKGKKIIFPQRFKEWEEFVEISANGLYYGHITDYSLEIMEAIDNDKKMSEILKIFNNQDHSGMTRDLVRYVVLSFSKKGCSFYWSTHNGEWSNEEKEYFEKIDKENRLFEMEQKDSDNFQRKMQSNK